MHENTTVEIWNATWVFYTKSVEVRSATIVTPHWNDNLHHLCNISYYVLKAANAACSDNKECFKQFVINKQTDLPEVKSIHYEKYIGESILERGEFLRQHGIAYEEQSGNKFTQFTELLREAINPDNDF